MDRHTCTPTDMLRLIPTLRPTRPAHPQSHARARTKTYRRRPCPTQKQTEAPRSTKVWARAEKEVNNTPTLPWRQAERPSRYSKPYTHAPRPPRHSPPAPARASGHRHIPFQTFGKTTGGDFNSCDFLSTLAVKVLLVLSLEMYRHQDTISLSGFHLELGCRVCVLG